MSTDHRSIENVFSDPTIKALIVSRHTVATSETLRDEALRRLTLAILDAILCKHLPPRPPKWDRLTGTARNEYVEWVAASTLPDEIRGVPELIDEYAKAVRIAVDHWLPCQRSSSMRNPSDAVWEKSDGSVVRLTRNQELVIDLMRAHYPSHRSDPLETNVIRLGGLCAGLAARVNYSRQRSERFALSRDDILASLFTVAPKQAIVLNDILCIEPGY